MYAGAAADIYCHRPEVVLRFSRVCGEKTICMAVSPSLKAYGIGGRARLFEVVQRVREVNNERKRAKTCCTAVIP